MRIVPGIGFGGVAFVAALAVAVVASFVSLSISIAPLFEPGAMALATDFLSGFARPDVGPDFLRQLATATLETIAMSAIGTLLAGVGGLLLSIPAAARGRVGASIVRRSARGLLAVLRAIPELVLAALFVIVAGLGPFSGTMALALHTSGVLGRLFAETIENLPAEPSAALRAAGIGRTTVFAYATLPQASPQFLSYLLYRWEHNIRAAAILGVVGAGGLGQMLMFHLSLFRMDKVATVVVAIIVLVAIVDAASAALRRLATR